MKRPVSKYDDDEDDLDDFGGEDTDEDDIVTDEFEDVDEREEPD